MTMLRTYDTKVAALVAHLPRSITQPFTLLGTVTSPMAWLLIIALLAVLDRPTNLSVYAPVLVCMPIATIVKFAFRRSRPPTIYAGSMRIKSYSFPSSHSYAAALSCTFLAGLAATAGLDLAIPLLVALALTVGVSRIYLGAHYPSDVTAGLLLGLLIGTCLVIWS